MLDLVGNPEDWFSGVAAQLFQATVAMCQNVIYKKCKMYFCSVKCTFTVYCYKCNSHVKILKSFMEIVINKQNRLIPVLGLTGVTYLLQSFTDYCLFQWARLSQVLEYIGTVNH